MKPSHLLLMLLASSFCPFLEAQLNDHSPQKHRSQSALESVKPTYTLPEIQVVAQQTRLDSLGSSSLNQTQLNNLQANNIASLLEHIPGANMVGSPRPGGQKINLWGMSKPDDVPIYVDGAIKHFDKYRQGSVFIEPELIKKITVNKGPFSPGIGSGGLGGSVVMETKEATDFLYPHQRIGGLLKGSYSSNNKQQNVSLSGYGKTSDNTLDGLIFFTSRDAGDITRADKTKFQYSAYHQKSILVKTQFRPTEDHRIQLNVVQSEHQGWEPFATMRDHMVPPSVADIKKYGREDAWKRKLVYRHQKDNSFNLAYQFIPENDYINISVKWGLSKTQQHDRRPDSASVFQTGNLGKESWITYKSQLAELTNQSLVSMGKSHHTITLGVQYQIKRQQTLMFDPSKRNNKDYHYGYFEPPYLPSGTQSLWGIYLQDAIELGLFTLSPSLRYDRVKNQGDGNRASIYHDPNPIYGHDYSNKIYVGFSPRLSLRWQPTSYLAWFADYAQVWKAPSVDNQYEAQYILSQTTGTSRNLEKETMQSIRLGGLVDLNALVIEEDRLQMRVTYFRNQGKNDIFKNRGITCWAKKINRNHACSLPVSNNRNLTGYRIEGIELEAQYHSPYFFIEASYSALKGIHNNSLRDPWFEGNTWLPDIPPRKGIVTLGGTIPNHQVLLNLGWQGIFIRKQDRSPLDQDNQAGYWALPKSKGYSLHNLFFNLSPKQVPQLQLHFTVNNLFNKAYYPYLGEAVSGIGRDYKVSLSYQF